MAVYTNTAVAAYVDSFGVHGFADRVELEATAEEKNFTTYSSGGWQIKKAGLANHTLDIGAFQDFATTGIDPKFPVSGLGGLNVFSVAPQNLAATVADPIFLGQGVLNHHKPLFGNVGDEARLELGWKGDATLVRGQVIHPEAARTTTGSGTITALVPPTATQSLYAHFHVLAVSGAGTITFTIQTDTLVGFGSPTTQITSSAIAAIGAERKSVAGSLAGENFVRVGYTIAGFTSCTFAVFVGVG
jgi:hypothetical protein